MSRDGLARSLVGSAATRVRASQLAETVARKRKEEWVAVTVPLDDVDVGRALDLTWAEDAFAWRTSGGFELGAAGAACVVSTEGASRFPAAAARARRAFSSLAPVTIEGVPAVTPRFVGGFAFEDHVPPGSAWAPFSALRFVLPRWTFVRDRSGSRALYIAGDGDADRAYRDVVALFEELDRPRPPAPRPIIDGVDRGDPAAWKAAVRALTASIRQGEVEKVVISRRMVAHARAPYRPSAVFSRLVEEPSSSVHFAVRRAGATFVGASPERLVRKAGRMIETEALAGSRALDDPPVEALVESAKDREEQAFVLRHVLQQLSGGCRALYAPSEPSLKRLRHVAHLWTPVQAELDRDEHLLEVAGGLHPTPAVGGLPLREAVARVAELEADARGWYTGAVGWFDARGDGDLWVGLRSALLSGRAAQLYVGAGIVRGSEPDAELRETEVKARGLLSALGVQV